MIIIDKYRKGYLPNHDMIGICKLREILDDMARSRDPNYVQIAGRVEKMLVERVKIECLKKGLTQSEAMEYGLRLWLETQETNQERDRHET